MDPYTMLASAVLNAVTAGLNRENILAEVKAKEAAGATPQEIAQSLGEMADAKLSELDAAVADALRKEML